MKKHLLLVLTISTVVFSCTESRIKTLSLKNPLDISRNNEVVEIRFAELSELTGEVKPEGRYVFLDGMDTLTSQNIDYDNDGIIDEVLLEISFSPGEEKALKVISLSQDEFPVFPAKTNIRFAAHSDFNTELNHAVREQTTDTEVTSKVFLMEGPAWENDRIGFRNYFDLRNGMDIFGKRIQAMVLDNVGVNENTRSAPDSLYGRNYHELNDWGMDILKVGNSLGAGALALLVNDSLYRVGDNGNGSFERLYEGPLRSEFRFVFPDWKAGENEYYITHYVSITAGSNAYKSSVFIRSKEEGTDFVTGIVNLHSKDFIHTELTGITDVFYTHDIQAFDEAYLTLALVMPAEQVLDFLQTREDGDGITQTYYTRMKTEANTQLDYWFYAFWSTADKKYENPENSIQAIRDEVIRRENPVEVIIQ